MSPRRIKQILFVFSVVLVGTVLGFLWLLNLKQPDELKRIFLLYIAVLWAASVAAFGIFYYWGDIFTAEGALAQDSITRVMVSILIVVQTAFGFVSYAYREMNFSFDSFDRVRELYEKIDWNGEFEKELALLPEEIDQIYRLDTRGRLVYANPVRDGFDPRSYKPRERYIFPLPDGGSLGMHISRSYHTKASRRILLDLFTVLVVSLFLGFELVVLIIRHIEHRIARIQNDIPPPCEGLTYIRQIAFLFYFAFRMPAAFIPVMAGRLLESAVKTNNTVAASIPQSAELLFTCVAIFVTSEMVMKRGWKAPFLAGIFFVVIGTLFSAFATSFALFALSRTVAGLGYGFCWMTLRSLSLFAEDPSERAHGFALFNAGLYAGRNSGSVLGAILADLTGYKTVLVIAALTTALCAAAVGVLKNAKLPAPQSRTDVPRRPEERDPRRAGGYARIFFFSLLLIVPSCIILSYSGYYLPLYTLESGGETADVGRAHLLYGILIVYAGPKLSQVCRKRFGNGLGINILYNLLLSGALVVAGLWGGLYGIALTMLLMGMADSFGFGVQNDYFLSLPLISGLPASRALSILSLLKKLAEILGPLTFALAISMPERRGVLLLGILFTLLALLSPFTARPSPTVPNSVPPRLRRF
ncbi:MAG: MFS transporter [Spirochaetaceae bacterium]|jgi:MFS family permease|nr:MFS transporter [Spirochaetaceae bacterium]